MIIFSEIFDIIGSGKSKHLIETKPLPTPMLTYCQSDHKENIVK